MCRVKSFIKITTRWRRGGIFANNAGRQQPSQHREESKQERAEPKQKKKEHALAAPAAKGVDYRGGGMEQRERDEEDFADADVNDLLV